MSQDAKEAGAKPPLPKQTQFLPGSTTEMDPKLDHGEESYRGSGPLQGRAAIIMGADAGIGCAIAIAREGADVLISYLSEHEDALETARWVEQAGRRVILFPGHISGQAHCRTIVEHAAKEFGRIEILVNNAAHQKTVQSLEEIEPEERGRTFRTNIHAMCYLCQAAVPHMKPGSAIVSSCSVSAKAPAPSPLPHATTRARS
jgi:NAD(P)-dependent dehydrogenase (short-subunit alcohol dehydrogenase family)